MIINHNLKAMQAHRQMKDNIGKTANSAEKLSSGVRIAKAGDDAAGLSISEKMRGQIRGLQQASRNGEDAISLIQTAEGAMQELQASCHRIRELEVQRINDTNITGDRLNIEKEMNELLKGIDKIAFDTSFNEKKLLDGSLDGAAGELNFQIGANSNQSMSLQVKDLTLMGLILPNPPIAIYDPNYDPTTDNVYQQLDLIKLDKAIKTISSERSVLGAKQNALEHAINNLNNGAENVQAAESRIRDVDMAKEMMHFSKENILTQSSQAMLAQANQSPNQILELLK